MKYEKPNLEELELVLEGSFLESASKGGHEVGKDDTEYGGDNSDNVSIWD